MSSNMDEVTIAMKAELSKVLNISPEELDPAWITWDIARLEALAEYLIRTFNEMKTWFETGQGPRVRRDMERLELERDVKIREIQDALANAIAARITAMRRVDHNLSEITDEQVQECAERCLPKYSGTIRAVLPDPVLDVQQFFDVGRDAYVMASKYRNDGLSVAESTSMVQDTSAGRRFYHEDSRVTLPYGLSFKVEHGELAEADMTIRYLVSEELACQVGFRVDGRDETAKDWNVNSILFAQTNDLKFCKDLINSGQSKGKSAQDEEDPSSNAMVVHPLDNSPNDEDDVMMYVDEGLRLDYPPNTDTDDSSALTFEYPPRTHDPAPVLSFFQNSTVEGIRVPSYSESRGVDPDETENEDEEMGDTSAIVAASAQPIVQPAAAIINQPAVSASNHGQAQGNGIMVPRPTLPAGAPAPAVWNRSVRPAYAIIALPTPATTAHFLARIGQLTSNALRAPYTTLNMFGRSGTAPPPPGVPFVRGGPGVPYFRHQQPVQKGAHNPNDRGNPPPGIDPHVWSDTFNDANSKLYQPVKETWPGTQREMALLGRKNGTVRDIAICILLSRGQLVMPFDDMDP